jgi:hypothetical protein
MSIKFGEFLQSSTYAKLLFALGALLAILLIFSAGMAVGYQRAAFSRGWNENYYGNMSRFGRIFEPFAGDSDNLNSHGAIGNIMSVNLPRFVVRGPRQAEQVVAIGSSTVVRLMRSPGTINNLKSGERVIVIGVPDQEGQIRATFIRIIAPPLVASTTLGVPKY